MRVLDNEWLGVRMLLRVVATNHRCRERSAFDLEVFRPNAPAGHVRRTRNDWTSQRLGNVRVVSRMVTTTKIKPLHQKYGA